MAYICEDELLNIYNSLEPKFESLGIETEVALIRDYLLKVTLSEAGNTLGKLIIDYSPKKGSHKFRRDSDLSEAEFEQILKQVWFRDKGRQWKRYLKDTGPM